MFVPPPPPPDLMNDTDGSDASDFGEDDNDFADIEMPDFGDSLDQEDKDDSKHYGTVLRKPVNNIASAPKTGIEQPEIKKENNLNYLGTSILNGPNNANKLVQPEENNSKTNDLRLPHIDKPKNLPLPNGTKIDMKQNLLVGELKGKLSRSDKIDEREPPKREPNVIDSPVNNFSKNIDNSPNIPRKDFNASKNSNLGVSATKTKPDFKPKALFNQIGNEVLDKNRKGLKETNVLNKGSGDDDKLNSSFENKFLVSNSLNHNPPEENRLSNSSIRPTFEIDSGHGTARSIELSDSDKNKEGYDSNPKPQLNSYSEKKTLRKTVSKTWSSCSSGVEDTDQNIDDDDDVSDDGFLESEIEKPKVNLRDLLKKMKSYDSDTDDETFDFKSGSQNDTVIRYLFVIFTFYFRFYIQEACQDLAEYNIKIPRRSFGTSFYGQNSL